MSVAIGPRLLRADVLRVGAEEGRAQHVPGRNRMEAHAVATVAARIEPTRAWQTRGEARRRAPSGSEQVGARPRGHSHRFGVTCT